MPLIALWFANSASAAEIVWMNAADPGLAERLGATAGATRPPLGPMDLMSAPYDTDAADDAAYAALASTLAKVRAYETRLDGELIIMEDLGAAIQGVTLIRDDKDRDALFASLAYQGFAVDRFFGSSLASDERAAAYRATVNETVVEAPWVDAVAIAPTREITPYEIAEAPQRIAYGDVQRLVAGALPARLALEGLPAGARVVLDGAPVTLDATGTVAVPPGRHFVHVSLEDFIIGRYDVRVGPAERKPLDLPVDTAEWDTWMAAFEAGEEPPGPLPPWLAKAVEALGGEVWLARALSPQVAAVWKLSQTGQVLVEQLKLAAPREDEPAGAVEVTGWTHLGWGWLNSNDFYLQDPSNQEPTFATVNASSGVGGLGVDLDVVRVLRFGVGVDALLPTGDGHVALTGDGSTRVRVQPRFAAGLRWVQVTAGYTFPYHMNVGGTAQIPLGAGSELFASAAYGLPPTATRDDGTVWEGSRIVTAYGGFGWRLP